MNNSLNHLQRQQYLAHRLDGRAWLPGDAHRASLSTSPLEIRGAVCEYRGDLPERCAVAGVKSFQHGCMCCTTTKAQLHTQYGQCLLSNLPFAPRSHEVYMAELRNAMRKVVLPSVDDRNQLVNALAWKHKYPWGRRVVATKGAKWGLRAGDKLVCGGSLGTDIHALDALPVPCEVWFFRPSKKSGIVGSSILWNIVAVHMLGIDHFRIEFIVDCVLHTIDLGVAQRYIGHSLRCLLRNNIYGLTHASLLDRLTIGALRLRASMKLYYKTEDARRRLIGQSHCTRIKCFTLKKLGDLETPALHAKGAQSRDMVGFVVFLFNNNPVVKATHEGTLLHSAGSSLLQYYHIIASEPRKVPFDSQLQLMSHCVNHLLCYKDAGGHMVPKHHGMVHLTQGVCTGGNPAYSSTYEDESENGEVGKIGITAHGLTWTKTVFEHLQVLDELDEFS